MGRYSRFAGGAGAGFRFWGMAMVLDMLTRTGKTVSQLVSDIPRYAMIKTKFGCTPEQSGAAGG